MSKMGAERRWLFTLFSAVFISLLFLWLYSLSVYSFPRPLPSVVQHGTLYPPAFAYYISGSSGDNDRILRLLLAVYHPRNRYLLHLGAETSEEERMKLVAAVNSVPVIQSFGNVDVVGKPSRLNHMGSSNVAAVLRAAAILLRMDGGWDWFVALSALDYPLVTQDDLSHVFSSIDRDVNFLDHTSNVGWKETQRFQPIIVDPALYLDRRSQIFYATEKRPTPDDFKVFTGSPWFILSRSFLEFCIRGWDNLPRALLMYFNNVVLSEESYFHSVICNAPEFKNTTVNSDLRFVVWDNPPKMEPHFLNISYYDEMVHSGATFARQFQKNDPVLDMIDERILKRRSNRAAPGAWCTGQKSWWMDPCSQWGDVNVVRPGPQAKKLAETMANLHGQLNALTNPCS